MTRLYEGSHQQYDVLIESNVMVPMRDGVRLATDIYYPATCGRPVDRRFPVILERTPYSKIGAAIVSEGKYFARRGYICVAQDVRGRFESEGEWYPFAKEAPDGYDTVEWLGTQSWSNGEVGTKGSSYAGSDQCALATLDPAHLNTMIVGVGASNYYHSSMRQNGALEQRFHVYVFRMALTSKEANADPALKEALVKAYSKIEEVVDSFPLIEGTSVLKELPSYERWAIDILTHGDYDDYWKQRGYAISEYYDQHSDVPTLYLGGWYDSYARNTCESYVKLNAAKSSDQRLYMGPWTHAGWEDSFAGDVDFGTESTIDYNDLRLAWFDYYMKGMNTEVVEWSPVTIFTMGPGRSDGRRVDGSPGLPKDYPGKINHGGGWRRYSDWPLPNTDFTNYFLHGNGSLSTQKPIEDIPPTKYDFDPMNPVPTMGGGISAADPVIVPGAFDQRGRIDFHGCKDSLPLNSRSDVLSFETDELRKELEITGPITMHLWVASSALDTDFTAKVLDVYPANREYTEGLAINITDSIIRSRYRNSWDCPEMLIPGEPQELVFELYPTSNVFREGHRLRLDISSSNWPRFDVNPNTGGPLGTDRTYQIARQTIYHDSEHSSHIVLPVQVRP